MHLFAISLSLCIDSVYPSCPAANTTYALHPSSSRTGMSIVAHDTIRGDILFY